MNLVNLKTFLKIIETGNLVGASQALHITQSTVTARLKILEQDVGQSLLHRHKSGIQLTPAGQRLERYANTMVELWSQARSEIALPDGINTVCNIGCHPDLWQGLGETLLNKLQDSKNTRAISVWRGNQYDLNHWMQAGLIDVCLSYWTNRQEKVEVNQLIRDQIVLVSTQRNSPLKFDPKYVFIENGEEFGREHAKVFSDVSTAKISFGDAELGLQYLLKKGGSAYLPLRIAASYLSGKSLYRVDDAPTFYRNAYLLVQPDSPAKDEAIELAEAI